MDTSALRLVRFTEIARVDGLVERCLHAPCHGWNHASVYRDELAVIVRIQLVHSFFAEYHVTLVAGSRFILLPVGSHFKLYIVDTAQGDGIDVAGIATGLVVVGVAFGIAQMHGKGHVSIDGVAFVILVGQRAGHFHVSGIGGSVGKVSVLEQLAGFVRIFVTLVLVFAFLTQGVQFRGAKPFARDGPCRCLAVFRHVEHETTGGVEIIVIPLGSLERHLLGCEVGATVTIGIACPVGQQQRLGRHVHHPPAARAEIQFRPILTGGFLGFHHELHLRVCPFWPQRALQRGGTAFRTGNVDKVARGIFIIVSIACHHELRGAFHGMLVHLHYEGFEV